MERLIAYTQNARIIEESRLHNPASVLAHDEPTKSGIHVMVNYWLEKNTGFSLERRDSSGNDLRQEEISDLAREFFEKLDEEYHFSRDYESGDLHQMFAEPITNAEDHGNEYDPDKKTYIELHIQELSGYCVIEVKVRDEGDGFDWKEVKDCEKLARGTNLTYTHYRRSPHPDTPALALFNLIRYCDAVSWNEKGNEITLIKQLKRIQSQTI